jgi:lipoprotein signal peptidase
MVMILFYEGLLDLVDRKLVGYNVGSFGFGILSSAIIYPLGYLESINVFRAMTIIGTALIFIGSLIRSKVKKKENHDKNI